MRLFFNLQKKATIIAKTETPYDVNGNKGITYRVALLIDGDVEKIKCADKDAFDALPLNSERNLICVSDIRNGSVGELKVYGVLPDDIPKK